MLIPRQQVLLMIDQILEAAQADKDKHKDYVDIIHDQGRISSLLQLKYQVMALQQG